MPYSNPTVLAGMFNATRNRMSPMNAARTKRQENLQNQFRERQLQSNEQQVQTQQKEAQRRLFKDIHDMKTDDRTEKLATLERETSEMLYAQQQGPEAWDRLMATKGKQVPFDQAESIISPGVGLGNAFKMYQEYEDRQAEQKLQASRERDGYKPTSLQTNIPFLAKKMGISEQKAAEILTMSEAMPEEQVINRIIIDLAKFDPDMSKEDLESKARKHMQVLKRVKQEAAAPEDPLGLNVE